jgi:type IV pilus assembly protein PilZ
LTEKSLYPIVLNCSHNLYGIIVFIKSHTLNISNGGLFLKTDNPLPIDSVVTLRMRLPGETEPMEIQGCVVWSNPKGNNNAFPSGMGIQFIGMNSEHRIKIDVFG